jgi:hypothetical protein
MVNHNISIAELTFPGLNLDVRVNVQLRDHLGRNNRRFNSDEELIAQIEVLRALSEALHFELSRRLAEGDRSVNIDVVETRLDGAHLSTYHRHHNGEQYDLFEEALKAGAVEIRW